jgi:hypothetical protein
MEPTYQIYLQTTREGQFRWAFAPKKSRSDSDGDLDRVDLYDEGKTSARFRRKIFYDDGRNRRLIYEVDFERDRFRYVLEKDGQNDGDVQRLVFPTLQAAVFCLAGCISRHE